MKKIQKILTAVSFSVVLAVFTVVGFYSFFDKDEKVSEMENRNLAQKPSFSASSYFSGDFASKFEEYYNDQFPGRNGLVKISNKIKSFYSFLKIDLLFRGAIFFVRYKNQKWTKFKLI